MEKIKGNPGNKLMILMGDCGLSNGNMMWWLYIAPGNIQS
jgi:hypothetical protein